MTAEQGLPTVTRTPSQPYDCAWLSPFGRPCRKPGAFVVETGGRWLRSRPYCEAHAQTLKRLGGTLMARITGKEKSNEVAEAGT